MAGLSPVEASGALSKDVRCEPCQAVTVLTESQGSQEVVLYCDAVDQLSLKCSTAAQPLTKTAGAVPN